MLSVLVTYIRAHLPKGEQGQDLIEYALLGGMIAVAIVAAITAGIMTGAIEDMVDGISGCIDFDTTSPCP